MRTLTIILFLTTLFSCSDRQTDSTVVQLSGSLDNTNLFVIAAINSKFPLRLNEIKLDETSNIIHLNDGIISKIEETIKTYAKEILFYDSTQTYRDLYINTIQLHDNLQTIYLVLLKHYPTGVVNSKVLFYNNQKKEFLNENFDLNLHALYDFNNGQLKPTNLKTDFKITTPEIEIVDADQDGINDFKLVRLWHNGTFNALQTTILTVKDNQLDTLHFEEKQLF
jgi:hypothetical protein